MECLVGKVEEERLTGVLPLPDEPVSLLGVQVGAVHSTGVEDDLLVPPEVVSVVLVPGVGPVVEDPEVGAVEGVEAPPGWGVLPGTVAQVPLAYDMCGVVLVSEELGQESEGGGQTSCPERLESSVLPAEVVGVEAGEEGGSGGGADLLDIALVQDHSSPGQFSQCWSWYGGVSPGNIRPAEVVRHYQEDVGSVLTGDGQYPGQHQAERASRSSHGLQVGRYCWTWSWSLTQLKNKFCPPGRGEVLATLHGFFLVSLKNRPTGAGYRIAGAGKTSECGLSVIMLTGQPASDEHTAFNN